MAPRGDAQQPAGNQPSQTKRGIEVPICFRVWREATGTAAWQMSALGMPMGGLSSFARAFAIKYAATVRMPPKALEKKDQRFDLHLATFLASINVCIPHFVHTPKAPIERSTPIFLAPKTLVQPI